jgi:hypothetical protein
LSEKNTVADDRNASDVPTVQSPTDRIEWTMAINDSQENSTAVATQKNTTINLSNLLVSGGHLAHGQANWVIDVASVLRAVFCSIFSPTGEILGPRGRKDNELFDKEMTANPVII